MGLLHAAARRPGAQSPVQPMLWGERARKTGVAAEKNREHVQTNAFTFKPTLFFTSTCETSVPGSQLLHFWVPSCDFILPVSFATPEDGHLKTCLRNALPFGKCGAGEVLTLRARDLCDLRAGFTG